MSAPTAAYNASATIHGEHVDLASENVAKFPLVDGIRYRISNRTFARRGSSDIHMVVHKHTSPRCQEYRHDPIEPSDV